MSDTVELLYNPLEDGFLEDPYPAYQRIREVAPLHKSPLGFWVAAGHHECTAILRHPGVSVDYANHSYFNGRPVPPRTLKESEVLLFLDPPRHTQIRALISPGFTRGRVNDVADFVDERVAAGVDRLLAGDEVDFVGQVAYPMAIDVISTMLGLGPEHFATVRAWSQAMARGLDPDFTLPPDAIERSEQAIAETSAFLLAEIDARRSEPRDDMLSELLQPNAEHGEVTEEEMVNVGLLLLLAGHETTANLLANSVHALLLPENEHVRQRLASDHDVIPQAIDELLRYDAPIQASRRVPLVELEIGGATLEPGDMVVLLLGSANRDGLVFDRPDEIVLDRSPNPHLGFSAGAHHCLGAQLAKLEAQRTLLQLAPLLDELELVEESVPMRPGVVVRGIERLLVRRR